MFFSSICIASSSKFQQENQKLSADVSRLRESESFLSGRVDELEQVIQNSITGVGGQITGILRKNLYFKAILMMKFQQTVHLLQ